MTLCRKSVHEFNLLVCEHLDILPTSPTKEQYLQFCNSIIENHNTKFVSKKCKTETQTLKLTKATGWTIYFTELDQPREVTAKAWNELPEDKKEHYKKIAVTQTHERLKEWRHTMSSFEQKTKDEIRNTYNIKNAKDIEFNMKKQDLQENLAFLGKQNNIDASTPVKHLKYLMTCELYNECIARDLYKNKQNYKKYTVPQQHTILPPKPPPPPSSPTPPPKTPPPPSSPTMPPPKTPPPPSPPTTPPPTPTPTPPLTRVPPLPKPPPSLDDDS